MQNRHSYFNEFSDIVNTITQSQPSPLTEATIKSMPMIKKAPLLGLDFLDNLF